MLVCWSSARLGSCVAIPTRDRVGYHSWWTRGPRRLATVHLRMRTPRLSGHLGWRARALITLLDSHIRAGMLRQTEVPVLVPASLGDKAGVLGAALAWSVSEEAHQPVG